MMRKIKAKVNINIAWLFIIPFGIWLGITDRVNWWTLVFVIASHIRIIVSFIKR